MCQRFQEREGSIIEWLNSALAKKQECSRKADQEQAASMVLRRDRGACKQLARIIILIENLLAKHTIYHNASSNSTWSRYYRKVYSSEAEIRLSDHKIVYMAEGCPKIHLIIDENMEDATVRELTEKAIAGLNEATASP